MNRKYTPVIYLARMLLVTLLILGAGVASAQESIMSRLPLPFFGSTKLRYVHWPTGDTAFALFEDETIVRRTGIRASLRKVYDVAVNSDAVIEFRLEREWGASPEPVIVAHVRYPNAKQESYVIVETHFLVEDGNNEGSKARLIAKRLEAHVAMFRELVQTRQQRLVLVLICVGLEILFLYLLRRHRQKVLLRVRSLRRERDRLADEVAENQVKMKTLQGEELDAATELAAELSESLNTLKMGYRTKRTQFDVSLLLLCLSIFLVVTFISGQMLWMPFGVEIRRVHLILKNLWVPLALLVGVSGLKSLNPWISVNLTRLLLADEDESNDRTQFIVATWLSFWKQVLNLGFWFLLAVFALYMLFGSFGIALASTIGAFLLLFDENIKDETRGIMMLYIHLVRGDFCLNDVISYSEGMGVWVSEIGTNYIRGYNEDGAVVTVKTSEFTRMINYTKQGARANIEFFLDPAFPTDVARKVIADVVTSMHKRKDLFACFDPESPLADEVHFVERITKDGLFVRIWLSCRPWHSWNVRRETNAMLAKKFQEATEKLNKEGRQTANPLSPLRNLHLKQL